MRVVIGLGANLGERLTTLRDAKARIARIASIVASSHLWETSPVGGPPQPDFLNGALLVDWDASALELLDALLAIEQEHGRVRDVRFGPRTLDLDVLWIDGQVVDDPRLVVPHPRLHERAFAMAPFLELVPDAVDPRTRERYVLPPSEGIRATGERL